MAEKRRLLDIWLIEANTIYREVPYTVVCDWLQQGRLLDNDRVRPTGSDTWHPIGAVPALAPFLPRAEPERVEDVAEALEPVEAEFAWKAKKEEEDDEVDMIPLIDVSLVLLVFFMMTAAVSSGVISNIQTPPAKHQLLAVTEDMYWLGINSRDQEGNVEKTPAGQPIPWYSLGRGNSQLIAPKRSLNEVLQGLQKDLAEIKGEVRVRVRGEMSLPYEMIRGTTIELQKLEARINSQRSADKLNIYVAGEVSEFQER